jgi:hypothetical protein
MTQTFYRIELGVVFQSSVVPPFAEDQNAGDRTVAAVEDVAVVGGGESSPKTSGGEKPGNGAPDTDEDSSDGTASLDLSEVEDEKLESDVEDEKLSEVEDEKLSDVEDEKLESDVEEDKTESDVEEQTPKSKAGEKKGAKAEENGNVRNGPGQSQNADVGAVGNVNGEEDGGALMPPPVEPVVRTRSRSRLSSSMVNDFGQN